MITVKDIKIDSSEEEITDFCNRIPLSDMTSEMKQLYMDYAMSIFALKYQKEILNEQNVYNKSQLFWSRILAFATIALVVATLLLIKF